jgi:hypothetical protein
MQRKKCFKPTIAKALCSKAREPVTGSGAIPY